jgi:hypothetical protein
MVTNQSGNKHSGASPRTAATEVKRWAGIGRGNQRRIRPGADLVGQRVGGEHAIARAQVGDHGGQNGVGDGLVAAGPCTIGSRA